MGRLIFKQPNGLYGRWSGVVDAFTWWNYNKRRVKKWAAKEYKLIVDKSDFKDYEKYDLDYIIDNEGFMICLRALREGDFEKDVYQAIKDMGGSEEQLTKILDLKDEAELELKRILKEEMEE